MPDRDLARMLMSSQDENEKMTELYAKELAARYRDAYKQLNAQLAALYSKLGDTTDGPRMIAEANRYNHLLSLQNEVKALYKNLTKRNISNTAANSERAFVEGAYRTQWAYDQAIGVRMEWPVLSEGAIKNSVWDASSGKTFEQRFKYWVNRRDIKEISAVITRGLSTGQSYQKTSRDLRDQVQMTYNEAVRIVRTENARNYTQGHLEVYDELPDMGIKARKLWVATLDDVTRDVHQDLDGELADEDGIFRVAGYEVEGPGLFGDPSEDINCRCRVVEVIENMAPELRRIEGKIVPYQSYKQWAGKK